MSTFLLIYSSVPSVKYLNSFQEADSLLLNNFRTFNIAERQVRERVISLDSIYNRKEYRVNVPPGFSKTQLHYEIHHTFREYNVETPAKVVFPEKDLTIYLVLDNTVFYTIRLQTDPELVLERSYGSILVAFDSDPSQKLLEKISSFGEPIFPVLMIDNPLQANELKKQLNKTYPDIFFWLQNEEGDNPINEAGNPLLPSLRHLQQAVPDAGVLSFESLEKSASGYLIKSLSKTSLTYVDVSEATVLHPDIDKNTFKLKLRQFSRKARRGEHPVAILMADEKTLEWLQQELADFKKSGLQIVPPKERRFN